MAAIPTLEFGQPADGIVQFAYTVRDAKAAARQWTELTGIGPWFLRGPFTTQRSKYRGAVVPTRLLVAQAFSGHSMIELIEQQDDAPSVYKEHSGDSPYGFHHIARATQSFDADFASYRERGLDVAYESVLPTEARLAYFDSREALGGMIELVELNAAQEAVYTRVYRAAQDWDGTDLFRTA